LALAQCYTAINRPDRAGEQFAAALAAAPADPAVLRIATDFYLRVGDRARAEECLRKAVGLGDKDLATANWARSVLAVVLANRGGAESSREALALVGVPGEGQSGAPVEAEDPLQERARAVVLALQPGRLQHQQAIDILERLNKRQPLSAEDQYLL